MKPFATFALLIVLTMVAGACVTEPSNSNTVTSQIPTVSPTPSPAIANDSNVLPVTLPVLDAFFADESFARELGQKIGLSEEQIAKLREAARDETSKLRESESGDYGGSTEDARQLAATRINELLGEEKAAQLFSFVRDRWQGANGEGTAGTAPTSDTDTIAKTPNAVPDDTRIVVNSPAYRMDVFENGQLVKSYKIGIGYPEFPLPTGLRKAKAIIFNPTWTPPDEPWVESPSSKIKVGQRIEAGSKLNPLGLLKIPIGSPSLIHGGKSPAKLGTFASHGCVGLTDPLVQDFAKVLARISGAKLTDADIANYKKNRSEPKQVTLEKAVPVELRYETIVAEDGKLHIYRDVYDRNTNTEENLRAVLEANGIKLEDLTEDERAQIMEALEAMSKDAKGKSGGSGTEKASASPSPAAKNRSGRVTRTVKGKKEIVIDVAALKGKGYPAMATGNVAVAKAKS